MDDHIKFVIRIEFDEGLVLPYGILKNRKIYNKNSIAGHSRESLYYNDF